MDEYDRRKRRLNVKCALMKPVSLLMLCSFASMERPRRILGLPNFLQPHLAQVRSDAQRVRRRRRSSDDGGARKASPPFSSPSSPRDGRSGSRKRRWERKRLNHKTVITPSPAQTDGKEEEEEEGGEGHKDGEGRRKWQRLVACLVFLAQPF